MALIAKAIMEPTSRTVAGRMSVSVVLANFPNLVWSHLGQGDSHILSSKKTGSWTGASSQRTSHLFLHAGRWANGKAPTVSPISEDLLQYVEALSEAGRLLRRPML